SDASATIPPAGRRPRTRRSSTGPSPTGVRSRLGRAHGSSPPTSSAGIPRCRSTRPAMAHGSPRSMPPSPQSTDSNWQDRPSTGSGSRPASPAPKRSRRGCERLGTGTARPAQTADLRGTQTNAFRQPTDTEEENTEGVRMSDHTQPTDAQIEEANKQTRYIAYSVYATAGELGDADRAELADELLSALEPLKEQG